MPSDLILDAMNITIDKVGTLVALKAAEKDYNRMSDLFKDKGDEVKADFCRNAATAFAVLIKQIETHGGKFATN